MPANHATGDKESTLKIDKVTVEALDFERMNGNDDDMPRFAKLRLEGMTGDEDMSPCSIPTASRGCRWTSCSTTASTAPSKSSP